MVVFPGSKINLGLWVNGKREDGYHNIQSCFVPVPWTDVLEFLPADRTSFTSTGIPVPGNPDDNLCLKAYEQFKEHHDLPPLQIHLHKVVPIGAGLGGGSADGAAMLKALNEHFELGESMEALSQMAGKLGADCPFFLQDQPQWVTGTGNIFEPVEINLKGYHLTLVNPGIHISTGQAYGMVEYAEAPEEIFEVYQEPPATWKDQVINAFEGPAFELHPELLELKEEMYQAGAEFVLMTGSGSTMVGVSQNALHSSLNSRKGREVFTIRIE